MKRSRLSYLGRAFLGAGLFFGLSCESGKKPAAEPLPFENYDPGSTEIFLEKEITPPDSIPATLPLPDIHDIQQNLQQAWDRALSCSQNEPDLSLPPVIVIDPGHRYIKASGEEDKGGAINRRAGLIEVEIIDAVSASLRNILQDKGYDVVVTREPGQPLSYARGDRPASLSVRGLIAAFLGEAAGRPVVLIPVHVDNVRSGGVLYTQNADGTRAAPESGALARAIAGSYKIGSRTTRVDPDGRFNNAVLRNFERAQQNCTSITGAAALLELGSVNDARDIPHLQAMLRNPEPAARQIARGIDNFAQRHYGAAARPRP